MLIRSPCDTPCDIREGLRTGLRNDSWACSSSRKLPGHWNASQRSRRRGRWARRFSAAAGLGGAGFGVWVFTKTVILVDGLYYARLCGRIERGGVDTCGFLGDGGQSLQLPVKASAALLRSRSDSGGVVVEHGRAWLRGGVEEALGAGVTAREKPPPALQFAELGGSGCGAQR